MGKYLCESEFGFSEPKYSRVRVRVTHECTRGQPYVKGCGICQQFKIDRNPSHPSYLPIPRAQTTRPFANCSTDFITDLPNSNRYDSILVVVDQGLSKGVILCPCTKTITSEDTGQPLLDNLYKRFGLPDTIISDRGPQFAAKAFRELLK